MDADKPDPALPLRHIYQGHSEGLDCTLYGRCHWTEGTEWCGKPESAHITAPAPSEEPKPQQMVEEVARRISRLREWRRSWDEPGLERSIIAEIRPLIEERDRHQAERKALADRLGDWAEARVMNDMLGGEGHSYIELEAEAARLARENAALKAEAEKTQETLSALVSHGTNRTKCLCEGCSQVVPSCWEAGMCRECCSESCEHAEPEPQPAASIPGPDDKCPHGFPPGYPDCCLPPAAIAPDDHDVGLYRKYDVKRLRDPEGKHRDCSYFVLDLAHDKHAAPAIKAYAESCRAEYPALADDLTAPEPEQQPLADHPFKPYAYTQGFSRLPGEEHPSLCRAPGCGRKRSEHPAAPSEEAKP